MKKGKSKGVLNKLIISIILITILIPTLFTTKTQAIDYGSLYQPISNLLVGIGDGFMWIANGATGSWEKPIIEEDDEIKTPNFKVTPEKIFSNQVPLINVNIINPSVSSIAYDLQPMVSSWYITFRNLAAVGLLSVLVYVAIRILLSSTASDKAKYKTMLKDWLVAFCLLFFMHYIMSFSITMIDNLTRALTRDETYVFGEEKIGIVVHDFRDASRNNVRESSCQNRWCRTYIQCL